MRTKKTPFSSIILVIISTVFTASGQILYKTGINTTGLSISILYNISIIAGIISYLLGGVLLITSLKKGELSVIYPFYSLSFIWVLIMSNLILGESITTSQIIGIPLIIIGVSLITR